jgi:serine/threonine protein phosphatase PrpC
VISQPSGPREQPSPDPSGRAWSWAPRTRHCGLSDCGPHRANNEDAFLIDERLGLFVVCDGVGGRSSGEIAAAEATSVIQEFVHSAMFAGTPRAEAGERDGTADSTLENMREVVRSAMQLASRTIFELGSENARYEGMSTTASVVLVVGEYAVIGQVGDTRVYHARGHCTHQITEDHTLLTMRAKHGMADPGPRMGRTSPITRALGLRDDVEVDIHTTRLMAGDRLLLCTDGLHAYLEPATVLQRLFQMNLQDAPRAAIRHASQCGSRDNATAVFVEILGQD